MSEEIINSRQSLDAYIAHLEAQWEKHKYLRLTMKTGKQRTGKQNNSLHKYCELVSTALNDAGLDMRTVLKPEIEIPWSGFTVKDKMWRPIQEAMYDIHSTTEPETWQYNKIYEVMSRHMSQKLGVYVPWPSVDTMENNK